MSDYSSVAPPQSNLNQSQAFAAALQRAKQIAAKIQPNAQQGSVTGFKRSHDDLDSAGPESKKFTSPGQESYSNNSNPPGPGAGGPANMSQALAQAAAVAARLAATAGTTCEEQIRYPSCIVGHMVGRGSNETLSHIQAESGCKVQLSQDSETLCTLRGSRETVTKGREMIQQLANQNGGGNVEVVLTINMPPPGPTGYPPYQEIMIPGTKVGLVIGKGGDTIKQLQEKTGAKMVIIQEGPNQELIKPLRISGDPQKIDHAKTLVLELIADKEPQVVNRSNPGMGGMNSGGGGGGMGHGGSGGFNGGGMGGGESAEVFVPKIAVGVVIGKGGDMIRKIQTECGCKLQFIQGKNDEPGDRRCVIQGTRQQVEDAKRTIEGLIENMLQRNRNTNNGAGGGDGANSNYGYGYGVNHTQQPAREEITFSVPASKCGIVIGRGGETIKLINQQTGAYCEMDRAAVNPPSEKLFKCKGTSEQNESARQMIAEKINMELPVLSRKAIGNAPPHVQGGHQQQQQGGYQMQGDPNAAYQQQQQQWGGYAQQGGWGGDQMQQQQQMAGAQMGAAGAAAGQADYSAQWIEYYKSMGMHREADMIEQQLKAKQAAGNPGVQAPQMAAMAQQQQQQPQHQPHQPQHPQQQNQPQQHPQQQQQQQQAVAGAAGGQGQDYSAQWAEYYRSIGKIEEAEAIEKQMKQSQNGQPGGSAAGGAVPQNSNNNAPAGAGNAPGGASGNPASGGSGIPQSQPGYPQGMTPSQYAQYSQYYAAAAAAGQQAGVPGGGYPQQPAYGGYGAPGGFPGAPQPGAPGGGNNNGGGGNTGGNQQKPGGNKHDKK